MLHFIQLEHPPPPWTVSPLSLLLLRLPTTRNGIIVVKPQRYTIDAMPLIRRRVIPLPLENMPQVSAAVGAYDLRPRHAERAVCMSRHGAGDIVEVCGPSTAGFELVVGFVEGRVAGGAGVDAGFGHVLVVFARERRFGAFFADYAELFCVAC